MPNNSAPTCFRDPQAVWPDPINPVLVYNIAKIVNNPLGERRRDHSVHAVLHESSHLIGHVSPEMADAILGGGAILLAAVHTQGHLVDLFAPVSETVARPVREVRQ